MLIQVCIFFSSKSYTKHLHRTPKSAACIFFPKNLQKKLYIPEKPKNAVTDCTEFKFGTIKIRACIFFEKKVIHDFRPPRHPITDRNLCHDSL